LEGLLREINEIWGGKVLISTRNRGNKLEFYSIYAWVHRKDLNIYKKYFKRLEEIGVMSDGVRYRIRVGDNK